MIINASITQMNQGFMFFNIVFSCVNSELEYEIKYHIDSNVYVFNKSTLSSNESNDKNIKINLIPLYKCNFSIIESNLKFNINQIGTIQFIKNQIKNAI